MRREQRKKVKKSSNALMYISGGILLVCIVAFVVAFMAYSNRLNTHIGEFDSGLFASIDNNINENTAVASSKIGKTVEESKNEQKNTATLINDSDNKKSTSEENKNVNNSINNKKIVTSSSAKTANKEEKEPKFQNPLRKSKILKEYAKENLIYSDTLKEWITHLGTDLKADKGTEVKASAEGTIKSIKNDPRYGLTVIIEHSKGYQTLYANLLTTEYVSEGDKVDAGQVIGTVGDTSVYEIVDEPHLHFEIIKNNESVNPNDYIKF